MPAHFLSAFSRRSGGTEARPTCEYILSKSPDMRSRTSSATRLMTLSGWSGGARSSRLTKASMVDTGDCAGLSWEILLDGWHGEDIVSRQYGERGFRRRFSAACRGILKPMEGVMDVPMWNCICASDEPAW